MSLSLHSTCCLIDCHVMSCHVIVITQHLLSDRLSCQCSLASDLLEHSAEAEHCLGPALLGTRHGTWMTCWHVGMFYGDMVAVDHDKMAHDTCYMVVPWLRHSMSHSISCVAFHSMTPWPWRSMTIQWHIITFMRHSMIFGGSWHDLWTWQCFDSRIWFVDRSDR